MRRIARWFLWGAVVLVVFHRPLVHFGGRWMAIRLAKKEHMDLDLRVRGNLWSDLELRDVSIRADGTGPAPMERMKLDRLALHYDLWKALRADWPRVLRRVELGTLDAVVAVQAQPPQKATEPPTPIAKALQNLLSKPLVPIEQMSIARVDLEVKDALTIRGFHLDVTRQKPGTLSWEKIQLAGIPPIGEVRAELAAGESSIAIGKLTLDPQFTLTRLSLNHATVAMPRGGLQLNADIGGGALDLRIEPSLASGALDIVVNMAGVGVKELGAPFHVDVPMPVLIESFHAKSTGAPEMFGSATAEIEFVIRSQESAPFPAATVRGAATWEKGALKFSDLAAESSGLALRLGGEVTVPIDDFDPARLSGEIAWRISGPDLGLLRIADVPPIQGVLAGAGTMRFEKGTARLLGEIETSKLAQGSMRITSANVHLDARRKLDAMGDIFAGLAATLSLDVKGITASGVRIDAFDLTGSADGHRVGIDSFSATSGENRISGSARAVLKPGGSALESPPEVDLIITAPKLEQFGVMVNESAFGGALTGDARLRLEGTQLAGNFQANGTGLRLGKTPLGEFQSRVKFENGFAVLDSLSFHLAEAGDITATGRMGLEAPMPYRAEAKMNLPRLGKLDAFLATAEHAAKLGGALTLNWTCEGQLSNETHNGKIKLLGTGLRHDALALSELRIGAEYSPQQVATEELLLIADKTRIGGRIVWKDGRLDASDLSVSIAGEQIVKGRVSLPLTPANANGPIPSDQPLNAHLIGKNMDIGRLASSFGIAAPVSGTASFDLDASGTLAKPDAKLTLEARSLRSTKMAAAAPADVDVKLLLSDARLTLSAIARQRDIQPLTVDASLPFNLEKVLAKPALAQELPVQMNLKLPASSLGIVPRFAPAVSKLDGTIAADVQVRGTVAKPIVNGEIALAIKTLRMAPDGLPPVSNLSSKILFRDDTATFQNTRGEIGGGSFNLDGNVKLTQPAQPVFDLRLRSDKVLVLRDESITVRADTDIALKGPLNSASATGTVFVTQSRFFKDVDILPLALPGRPKTQVRTVAAPTRISFPNAPLRDWKFDIAIKTREKDSFLIRGNLAKGAAALDLRLGGTGLNPFLSGHVQVENFTAVLPVSKLEVRRGYVTFSPENPFQPVLDIQAESRIRKNTVTVNITGTGSAPRMELESEPPLPQQDILSLLTTGTTTSEIGSNASALATKAALLTVKRWYRKKFPGRADSADANGNSKEGESLLDRFEMDIGNVDPKTGRPDVTGSVKLNDNLYFLGDIDMQGQFTGKVKYLIRFR